MAQVLLFPSVLGARQGITDLADALTGAGHSVTTVDHLEGVTFDDYPTAAARSQEIGFPAQMAYALEAARAVEGAFVAVGFSNGAAMAQWIAAQRPADARGVIMVGGGMPMRHLEATWPPGVPGQVHVTAGDPFHAEDRQFDPMVDEQLQDDVEHAGGAYSYVEYQGDGHLFNDPTLPAEYQPEEARILTRRVIEFVDEVG
ncbi:dienelactone hydrolase family protein [Janibacter indicus]|uniref:Dienelactone hydrolase n=1 Tax=Janibacter indicus TaxID=857417 RepID=A0A1W1Z4N6_9MICO|nr:dienelactone hydrolase family protein [Janibacter indicus]SMC43399.1 Dienelactone hydrolase [Janibacter indicus]